MPRYIDEKDVYALVEPMGTGRVHCSQIDALPRADVAPKSEVERLEKENETLTIQRNAWYLAAERVAEDFHKARAEVNTLTENSITAKYPHCVLGSYYAILTKSLEDYDKLIADISSEAKADVAKKIFAEIAEIRTISRVCEKRGIIYDVSGFYAELKKKYTEGE